MPRARDDEEAAAKPKRAASKKDPAETLTIDGREVSISNPQKVLFPGPNHTKLDLVKYYLAVADPLMETIRDRPVLLQRFPEGAGGKSFFQKRVPKSAPDWLETTIVSTPNGTTSRALVAADLAHVIWAVEVRPDEMLGAFVPIYQQSLEAAKARVEG